MEASIPPSAINDEDCEEEKGGTKGMVVGKAQMTALRGIFLG